VLPKKEIVKLAFLQKGGRGFDLHRARKSIGKQQKQLLSMELQL